MASNVKNCVLYARLSVTKEESVRGNVPLSGRTVRDHWQRAWGSDDEKRAVFCSQLESLHIRRGVAGRRFDADRVLLRWRASEGSEAWS